MKPNIFQLFTLILILSGCRERSADDYHYFKPYQKQQVKEILPDTISKPDSVKPEVIQQPPIEKLASNGVNLNDQYFIVVASYVVEDYAIAHKQRLTQKGFKPEIFMVNDDGWFKLAVQSYKTLAEAEAGLRKLIDHKLLSPDARIVFRSSKQ